MFSAVARRLQPSVVARPNNASTITAADAFEKPIDSAVGSTSRRTRERAGTIA